MGLFDNACRPEKTDPAERVLTLNSQSETSFDAPFLPSHTRSL
jgi:hypothetical protein